MSTWELVATVSMLALVEGAFLVWALGRDGPTTRRRLGRPLASGPPGWRLRGKRALEFSERLLS